MKTNLIDEDTTNMIIGVCAPPPVRNRGAMDDERGGKDNRQTDGQHHLKWKLFVMEGAAEKAVRRLLENQADRPTSDGRQFFFVPRDAR